jgi:hypothetical protein
MIMGQEVSIVAERTVYDDKENVTPLMHLTPSLLCANLTFRSRLRVLTLCERIRLLKKHRVKRSR